MGSRLFYFFDSSAGKKKVSIRTGELERWWTVTVLLSLPLINSNRLLFQGAEPRRRNKIMGIYINIPQRFLFNFFFGFHSSGCNSIGYDLMMEKKNFFTHLDRILDCAWRNCWRRRRRPLWEPFSFWIRWPTRWRPSPRHLWSCCCCCCCCSGRPRLRRPTPTPKKLLRRWWSETTDLWSLSNGWWPCCRCCCCRCCSGRQPAVHFDDVASYWLKYITIDDFLLIQFDHWNTQSTLKHFDFFFWVEFQYFTWATTFFGSYLSDWVWFEWELFSWREIRKKKLSTQFWVSLYRRECTLQWRAGWLQLDYISGYTLSNSSPPVKLLPPSIKPLQSLSQSQSLTSWFFSSSLLHHLETYFVSGWSFFPWLYLQKNVACVQRGSTI